MRHIFIVNPVAGKGKSVNTYISTIENYINHIGGYSILENETDNLKKEITEFVAVEENVKIYLMKLTNKEDIETTVGLFLFNKFDNWRYKGKRSTVHANVDGKIILYSNVQTKGY